MDHLSSLDASFLHLETPETPMHVASLALLKLPDGADPDSFYDNFKEMMGKRLHMAAMLNRKLAPMPFELAEPVWIDDADIDLDYHIRSLTLRRPGTMEQLHQLIARIHSSLLDRSRPLWEMYIIDGLEDGRIAFYNKMHHSGVDGRSGMEMAKVLYDPTAEVREVPPARRRQKSDRYQLGVTELLQAAVSNAATQYRKLIEMQPTALKALSAAGSVLAGQRTGSGERKLTLGTAPKTIFNDSITNQRSYCTISLPFVELKQLGKRVGGTVNTIVMAMCSSALRKFLAPRGLLPKEGLIAAVPVSLRSDGDGNMNNQVTMVRVDLATDIADPVERFKAIHASSEAGKAVVRELKPVLGVDLPMAGTPWIVSGLASLYGRSDLARQLPAMASVTISNVPGPAEPLYICGALMENFYPVSIPYHGSALNITVHSYGGSLLEFGLIACRRILSQQENVELTGYLLDALEEIKHLPSIDGTPADGAKAKPKEPGKEAPAKAEPAKAEPAKAEAPKPEAAKPETAKPEAAPEAAKPAPTKSAAAKATPAKSAKKSSPTKGATSH